MTDETQPTITELVDEFLSDQRRQFSSSQGQITYTQSVQAFVSAADWLGAEHMPSLVTLFSVAGKLDREVTAAMVAQFGVTFRDLRSQAPGGAADDEDPLEAGLRGAGK